MVTRGAAVFMAMRWGMRAIGLISTMVLARVLVPADFGLVAIATSYITILNTFTEMGGRSAILRHGFADQGFLDTVMTLQLVRGVIIAAVVAASGFVFPHIMNDPRLAVVMPCLALEPVISAFLNPRMVLFEGQLNFKPEAILQVTAKTFSTGFTIAIALYTHSYWALIAGTLMASSVRVIISYMLAPAIPRFGLSSWRELFGFSSWITAASMFDSLATGFDQLIVGAILNVRTAGLYNIGAGLAAMPLGEFLPVVNRALLPGMLKFKNDPEKMRQVALDVVGFLAGVSLPVGIGFCFVAPEFIRIFYGPKWTDAIVIVQVLSLCAALGSVGGAVASSVALSLGRTDLIFGKSFLTLVLRLPPFVIGTWLYGLSGSLFGYFAGSLAVAVANLTILRRTVRISYSALLGQLLRSVGAVLFMSATLLLVQLLLPVSDALVEDLTGLVIKLIAGVVSYSTGRLLLWRFTGVPESLDSRVVVLLATLGSRLRRSA